MDAIIEESKKVFCKVLNIEVDVKTVFESLQPGDFGGLCGVSQSSIYYVSVKYLDVKDVKPIQVHPYFSGWGHACVVIKYLDKEYIADLTITQFMKKWDEVGIEFVKKGYIELTDSNLEWLFNLLEKTEKIEDKRRVFNDIPRMELDHDEDEIMF
jgi:hypothetical protein